MPDSQDYRKYLESRFDNLTTLMNAQFTETHEWLNRIEAQTLKTNNRVNHLEGNVSQVEKDLLSHPVTCGKGEAIDKIKTDLEEYRVLKRYPKIAGILLVAVIIMLGIAIFGTYKSLTTSTANNEILKDNEMMKRDIQIIKQELQNKPSTPANAPYR